MLDIKFENKLIPQKGRLLISDPFQADEFFQRSVVYLCEHSSEGSFGFVLNNLVEIKLNQLNDAFPPLEIQMSLGGPVETETMYFIHTLGDQLKESLAISHGIYIGGDFNQLYTFIQEKHIELNEFRFFLGYSGWSKGQLDQELEENAWMVAEFENANEIMQTSGEEMWKYFMEKQGKKYQLMTQFPLDPSDN